MLSTTRIRALRSLPRAIQVSARRTYAFTGVDNQELNTTAEPKKVPNVSKTNELPMENPIGDKALSEDVGRAEELRVSQAPNRTGVWSRSQSPREKAMSGPRFEQTLMEFQPAPYAAIDLIHQQPVRWMKERYAECDGGGGPLGHPKIFINLDKPQVCMCTYCGIPFANEHHKHHLESLPKGSTPYPLYPEGKAAEINESQRVTDEPLGQR